MGSVQKIVPISFKLIDCLILIWQGKHYSYFYFLLLLENKKNQYKGNDQSKEIEWVKFLYTKTITNNKMP